MLGNEPGLQISGEAMHFWQVGLLVFAVLWGLQIAGTAYQMKHYRTTLRAISERWNDGFVGSGNARARLGAGAIAIVVAAPDSTTRQVLVMRGRTVFAHFKPVLDMAGVPLAALRDGSAFSHDRTRATAAIQAAVAQIDRVASERESNTALPDRTAAMKLTLLHAA